ncbi:hypothetical protein K438DRAFT_1970946 [Mycena galopus ATCC 62051]|nr:hypothetical protein K438DRAFT_1970946 [Mycena galopus ATCC 62051]
MPSMLNPSTPLDVFREHVANADTRSTNVVECADECWTYEDLDIISNGLALELESRYGARPTVAIIAENLPYTLALSIAVWKLRGIVAPMDYHAPAALLQPMLATVTPACVAVPSTEKGTQQVVLDAGFPLLSFAPEETSMTALSQRFVDAPDLPRDQYPSPDPSSIFLYIFTSSASNVSNLKCVPLSHETLLVQTNSILKWNRRAFPESVFEHIRVLGFNPFSHIWGFLDIFLYVFLTGGCYIFALTPSSYFLEGASDQGSRDVVTSLLLAMERYRPDSWAAIPFMFDGIIGRIKAEPDSGRREEFIRALQRLKVCEMGGAAPSEECINFVLEHKLRVAIGLGMTEVGGLVFKRRMKEETEVWWAIEDTFMPDAQFTLVDDGKTNDSEGELYISSKLIAKEYVKQNHPSFALGSDGVITFRTGDRYAKSEGRIKWLGRNDDFVVLLSGEMVDPRILEKTLNASPLIARSGIIGNNFLRGSSLFLCALIELRADVDRTHPSTKLEISRTIRTINRELVPPLRINWTRVIILEEGEQIPINKKREIWRKKLEALFETRVAALSVPSTKVSAEEVPSRKTVPSKSALKEVVLTTVAHALNLPAETLKADGDLTFAELGMDSAAALVIVGKLNEHFSGLNLPRNVCHTHVDLDALTAAISERLSRVEVAPSRVLPSVAPAADLGLLEEVVIVGQAVRLPGDLNTPDEFWEALVDMREDLLIPIPQDRWDHASFYRKPGDPAKPGDITFERAGFVEVQSFDNTFFGISAPEAFSIAPSARLVLETTWQALENANIPISSLKGTETGVFAAASMDQGYTQLIYETLGFGTYTRFHGSGTANSASCGRLSYLLDVHGPSVTYDTACSSGMVAFDQAVQYLRSGKAETAIVCGGNSHVWPGDFGFTSAQKMTSPNSRCATFASDADGYVPAEGAVTLILKTKRAALRDGDAILADIKTTDTNHNGRSQGLVAPNSAAQAALQRSLLAAASMSPSDIDFIETHGTGTSLGDLIEIEGINSVFRGSHTPDRPLVLGAAKTAVGHTETIAGLVGIVKAIKQLSTGQVAGLSSLAGGKLNPEIDTALVPLHIPASTAYVPARKDGVPLRALVLAYGFAGSLAGTILEAPQVPKIIPTNFESSWMVFTVSAKSPDALSSYLRQYLEFCANAPAEDFQSICYTSCVGRELYRYRFSCVVKDLDGLVQRLKDRLSQANSPAAPLNSRVIFAFPGQGSQFFGMAKALSERFSQFKEILADAAEVAAPLVDFDVLSLMLGTGQPTDEIDKSAVAQICIFIYQYSVGQFLRTLKIVPDAVMGNSLGDISAAVAAGAMSYELGLQFVVARAKMLSPHPDHPAGMAAVAANADTITKCIQDLKLTDRVVISVFSSPGNNVVSGDLDAVRNVVSHVKKTGTRATLLSVDQGFHSHCIDTAVPQLEAWNADNHKDFRPLDLPLFSTVLGKQVAENETLGPRYWVDHARNPVQFAQAVEEIKRHPAFKTACVVDVGPTPTALAALQSNEMSQATLFSSAAKKGKDQGLAFLTAIASLVEYGASPDFASLFGTEIPKTNNLPTYPFQRHRHWPSVIPSRSGNSSAQVNAPSSLVVDETLYKTLDHHRINGDIVMPGSAMVDLFAKSSPHRGLDNIRFQRPWSLHSSGKLAKTNLVAGGAFSLTDSDNGDKLCTGSLASAPRPPNPVPSIPSNGGAAPNDVVLGDDIYASFVNVKFGPLFRNVTSVTMWDDHADGLINVQATSSPDHDRIRALDACLHMFGAFRITNSDPDITGAFLPMQLQGFSLHTDVIPSSFICRYTLPLKMERNNHVASTSFEVVSHSGELLASCTKYSVGWVDMAVPVKAGQVQVSFQQVWTPRELGAELPERNSKLVYFGKRNDWIDTLSASADKHMFGKLSGVGGDAKALWQTEQLFFAHVVDTIDLASDSTVILDATTVDDAPDSPSFSAFWHSALRLLQALGRSKTRSFRLIVISTTSVTVGSATPAPAPSVLGAMVQGMLRVFRTETGLNNAYGIEFPPDASSQVIADTLKAELATKSKESLVAYRYSRLPGEAAISLRRFVPEFRPPVEESTDVQLRGVAVVVGMGSIGFALGPQMIAAGSSAVVFLGRRPPTDEKVAQQLATLAKTSGTFTYMQADASDIHALRRVLQNIQATHGEIKHILHTAAAVSDAPLETVTTDSFERVIRPKVHGAYNLHLLTAELSLDLDSFALFSSISGPLGNPGQAAYVAANSFVDSLAAYRRSMGLPGVSLQLGPWESELEQALPESALARGILVTKVSHKDGLPLILRALLSPVAVQVIAAFAPPALSRVRALATDSLFAPLVATVAAAKPLERAMSNEDISKSAVSILREILELADSEPLELNESLSACGVDSIAFGQIRAAVMKRLGVDVPLVYLSDAFTVNDMIGNIQESVAEQAAT